MLFNRFIQQWKWWHVRQDLTIEGSSIKPILKWGFCRPIILPFKCDSVYPLRRNRLQVVVLSSCILALLWVARRTRPRGRKARPASGFGLRTVRSRIPAHAGHARSGPGATNSLLRRSYVDEERYRTGLLVILAELLLVILVNDKWQPRGTFGPALLIGTVGEPRPFSCMSWTG